MTDDCGMPRRWCAAYGCPRTRPGGEDDEGPWLCWSHAHLAEEPDDRGPPTDAECDRAADAYERSHRGGP